MTTDTKKRNQSEAGRRKRAASRYIDAQAATAKARVALDTALERYAKASADEELARDACADEGLPVSNPPAALQVSERAKP